MQNSKIYIILLIIFISCKKTDIRNNLDFEIAGNTYSFQSNLNDEIDIIDFQDSTLNILGKSQINSWKLSYYENIPFLTFERAVSGIKKVNDSVYNLHPVGYPNDTIKMTLLKPKWKKEMIYGTWIEERFLGTDSSDFPPPPILDVKTNWPPSYLISKEKIVHDFYTKTESKIRISNNGEFISMNLIEPMSTEYKEKSWRITYLSDSLLIVNRKIQTNSNSYLMNEDAKFIKKR
ncbi:MAG: hypothetical protein GYB35_16525 [Algicola sp.]|nr:hypothetical protein [Algicola sp.]